MFLCWIRIIKKTSIFFSALLLLCLIISGQENIIDFKSDQWNLQGRIVDHLGKASLMGAAFLKDVEFENGVIEVDMAFEGSRCFAGILFRIRPGRNYENFYIRPHKTGQYDALQYTPVFNGNSGWQLYSGEGYTAAAPIPHKQWVHVKLEVYGSQARVYLDHSDKPFLVVHDLKHGQSKGSIGLSGTGNGLSYFSNFKFTHDDSLKFDPPPSLDSPKGMLMDWEISQPIKVIDLDREVHLTQQKLPELKWKKALIEDSGLVDIARVYGKATAEPLCILAKTVIYSEQASLQKLNFGYSDEISIFLNQQILFRGNSEFRRRDPHFQGTVGLNDAVFLPLKKGENDLLFYITENFGGWGFKCRLGSLEGEAVRMNPRLSKIWESKENFPQPESACYDSEKKVIYISNFGSDFISRITPKGEILDQKWITGLEKPTGLAKKNNRLYAVERKNLVEIDIDAAKILQRIALPEPMFPNDVAITPDGNIFVSDSQRHAIYCYSGDKFEVWMQGDKISNPNGLFAENDRLIVGTSREGCFKAIGLKDQKINTLLYLGSGSVMDGIKPDGQGGYYMGDWTGRIFHLSSSGNKEEIMNTQDAKIGLADFEYIQDEGLFIIPTLNNNRILAFKLNGK